MAACSGKPFVRSDSYDSSRCAASSACTSSVSAESRARPERRWRTSSCQSGMGHLLEPPQCSEQFRPFLAERRKLFLPGGSEAIAAAAAAIVAGFPIAANPAALLHAVQHGIQGGEGEVQRAFGLPLDAARHLIAVQRTIFKNNENRKFRGAALDSSPDHRLLPYMSDSYL